MEFHESAKLDRDSLVIERAEALLPIIDEQALPAHREWANKQIADYIHCASWQLLRYPLTRMSGTYTALDWAIFPNVDNPFLKEARDRVADLLQIVRAQRWPLVWYSTPSHDFTAKDEEEIRMHVDDLHAAFIRSDYDHISRITGLATLHANDFLSQTLDVLKREEVQMFRQPDFRVSDIDWAAVSFEPRFDGRIVKLVPRGNKKNPGIFTTGPDSAGFDKSVVLRAVRSSSGWLLAR